MRISYNPLFSVECLHGYFADHVCKALTLRPTAAWARLLQRYRLLFRPSAGGGTVYYAEPAGQDLLRLYRDVTPFAFVLTSSDPLLDIYTESDVAGSASPGETVHYFSNRDEYAANIYGRPRLLLHPADGASTRPPLPVRAPRFTHFFDGPVRTGTLRVSDVLLGQPVWEAPMPDQDVRAWPIDLRAQPCGRYVLSFEGQALLDFYLSDTPAVRQWGVVEIFPGDAGLAQRIPAGSRVIDEAGVPLGRTFTIWLASRETVWRYYIFDQPQQESRHAGYEIVGVRKRTGSAEEAGLGDIRFTRKAETVTLNGRAAVVFESEQAVPLSEVPTEDDYVFTFKANGRSERGGRSIKLPFAQPAATRIDATPGATRMCSEIFVYL